MQKLKTIDYYIGLNVTCAVGLLLVPVFMLVAGPLRFVKGAFNLVVEAALLPINAMNAFTKGYMEKKLESIPKNTKNFDGFGDN